LPRYSLDRHKQLLDERIAAVSRAGLGGARGAEAARIDSQRREDLVRRIMVRHLSRIPDGPVDSEDLRVTVDEYAAGCEPTDLRQMDVLHSVYESVRDVPALHQLESRFRPQYGALLRSHLSLLSRGLTHPYTVSNGRPATIAPTVLPVHVLVLGDNFLSASRSWQALSDCGSVVRPRLLFCDNQGSQQAFRLRVLSSLARLVMQGRTGLALSMMRARPRISRWPLSDAANTAWLRESAFDVGLHNMGVIYRRDTIAAFRLGILNAHIGHLPGLRGRSVLEWSLVYGVEPCVSTFFVDEGIDTGALIVDRYTPPAETANAAPSLLEAKRRFFELDGQCYRRAIARLVSGGEGIVNEPVGRRFYTMSRLLTAAISQP
jgi:hypothetical protein